MFFFKAIKATRKASILTCFSANLFQRHIYASATRKGQLPAPFQVLSSDETGCTQKVSRQIWSWLAMAGGMCTVTVAPECMGRHLAGGIMLYFSQALSFCKRAALVIFN